MIFHIFFSLRATSTNNKMHSSDYFLSVCVCKFSNTVVLSKSSQKKNQQQQHEDKIAFTHTGKRRTIIQKNHFLFPNTWRGYLSLYPIFSHSSSSSSSSTCFFSTPPNTSTKKSSFLAYNQKNICCFSSHSLHSKKKYFFDHIEKFQCLYKRP